MKLWLAKQTLWRELLFRQRFNDVTHLLVERLSVSYVHYLHMAYECAHVFLCASYGCTSVCVSYLWIGRTRTCNPGAYSRPRSCCYDRPPVSSSPQLSSPADQVWRRSVQRLERQRLIAYRQMTDWRAHGQMYGQTDIRPSRCIQSWPSVYASSIYLLCYVLKRVEVEFWCGMCRCDIGTQCWVHRVNVKDAHFGARMF